MAQLLFQNYSLPKQKILFLWQAGAITTRTDLSGRGASNQSNHGIIKPASREKSNHGNKAGGKRSEPQRKTNDQSSNRNTSLDGREG
jgi:hypothetical protein